MPISPIGTVSGAKPTLLARGVKYRVFGPSGGGALNPTYQALGVSALKLTPRLTSEGVSDVPRLIGPGDVLIVDGDQYASLINVAPQIPARPSGALATFSFLTTPANLYIEPIAPGETVTEITHKHRSAAQIFCPTTVGVQNGSEQWMVPNGQRWRLLWISLRMDTHSTSTDYLSVYVWRGVSNNGPTIDSTGNQTVAGSYTAWSDSISHGSSSGGTSLLIPTYPVLVPGDSVNVSYAVGDASDTVTFTVVFEVEADA